MTPRESGRSRIVFSEILEPRRLLHGSFTAWINFQPPGTTENGYLADTGKAFQNQNGLKYGWNEALSPAAVVDRNDPASPSELHDTLAHMQTYGERWWGINVANGEYKVRIVAGDAQYFGDPMKIHVEGVAAIDFTNSPENPFMDVTTVVTVKDGKLTVGNLPGGTNNKIAFLQIEAYHGDVSTPTDPEPPSDGGTTTTPESSSTVKFAWTQKASSPTKRTESQSIAVNGKLYVFGGFYDGNWKTTKRSDAYDPKANSWKQIADLPTHLTHAGIAHKDGKIYFVGGFIGNHPGQATSDVWVYDTGANKYTALNKLPAARGAGAAVIIDNKLYFTGGLTRKSNGQPESDKSNTYVLDLNNLSGGWKTLASLPKARNHVAGAALDGMFYVIGGQTLENENTGLFNRVDRYDPKTNTWTSVASLPEGRSHISNSIVIHDGQIIIAGGTVSGDKASSAILSYDPKTNVWTRLPSLAKAGKTVALAMIDGKLVASTGGNPNAFAETYVATFKNAWWTGPKLPVSLGETAGGVIGNKIYLVGDGNNSTLAYDLSKQTWSSGLAKRPHAAKDHLSEVYNGKLYLFGGVIYSGGMQILDKVQIYDPANNKWTSGATMPFKTLAAQTALIDGEIYVAGGVSDGNLTTKKFAKYNPSTNKWTVLPDMPVARNSGATGTDGQKMYIFGGRGPGSGDGDKPGNGFSTVLIYDPKTGQWQNSDDASNNIKPLPQARGGIVKAPFVNGEFYVIGGETVNGAGATSNNVYKRVDIYNPVTNTWRRGPDMPTGKHGITPLSHGGRIFIAGGGIKSGKSESNIFDILQL